METERILSETTAEISALLFEMSRAREISYVNRPGLKNQVILLIRLLRSGLYPSIFGNEVREHGKLCEAIRESLTDASELMERMLSGVLPDGDARHDVIVRYLRTLPSVARTLETDVRAAYDGDPAARSEEEIVLAYPAFEAISIFRLAHELFRLGVPLIPRMMTEYAHQLTGIDIHPGATIGRYFFIDHGTGVVIGETCTIGDHVKLYQGVTLGAKSFELDGDGNPVKGIKRHPDIGNHVVIYAGATILGGTTVIGDRCVIGGNVWLTHSVPAGQTVYYTGN